MVILFVLVDSLSSTLFLIFHILISRWSAVSIVLSNQSMVSLALDPLMLLVQHVGLQAQHPWDTNKGDHEEDDLDKGLTSVELFAWLDCSRRQEHVDQHVEQIGWGGGRGRPVDGPLVDDTNDEVSKDTVEKEELGDEFGIDVEVFFEVQMVGYLQADGECHLIVSYIASRRGEGLTWMIPRMIDIFILSELVKMRALSAPFQYGSIPKG